MKLAEVTWQHRFDFDGILECEHCKSKQSMKNGYNDANFHHNVIPAIKCISCGKRSTEQTLDKITDPGTQGAEIIEDSK